MDPRDNSVTFSPALFEHLGGFDSCHKVYAFKIGNENDFGFTLNPEFDEKTQIADVQVNTKTKEVGFECLCPSVVMMFARWCFDLETPRKVAINELYTLFGSDVYEFDYKHSVCL